MPAIVGIVNINTVSTSSVFHIGDTFLISPASSLKTFSGAGSFNTGDYIHINNNISHTNTYDKDIVDQPIAGNL